MSEYKKINRLLIVSSRSRNKVAISGSILSNVIKLEYDYETSTLSDLVTFPGSSRGLIEGLNKQ